MTIRGWLDTFWGMFDPSSLLLVIFKFSQLFGWNGAKYDLIWLLEDIWSHFEWCSIHLNFWPFFQFWSTFWLEMAKIWLDVTIGSISTTSYFGSRYSAIGIAAPGDTFMLERGAAECSSSPKWWCHYINSNQLKYLWLSQISYFRDKHLRASKPYLIIRLLGPSITKV